MIHEPFYYSDSIASVGPRKGSYNVGSFYRLDDLHIVWKTKLSEMIKSLDKILNKHNKTSHAQLDFFFNLLLLFEWISPNF